MSKLRSYNQVWGTCNGFELLTVLSSRDKSRLTDCDSQVKRRRDVMSLNDYNPLIGPSRATELHPRGRAKQSVWIGINLQCLHSDGRNSLCLQAPPDVMREIKQERITINFHNHCLTPANFTKSVRILTKLNT